MVERVKELQVSLRRENPNVADRSSEHARLSRVLLDRDSLFTYLRLELSNLIAERNRDIHDHRTLRDRLTSLVTGDPLPISTSVAPIVPFSGVPPSRPNPELPSHKRLRETVHSRSQFVPKKIHSSFDLYRPILTGW